jgi:hypothetical protein
MSEAPFLCISWSIPFSIYDQLTERPTPEAQPNTRAKYHVGLASGMTDGMPFSRPTMRTVLRHLLESLAPPTLLLSNRSNGRVREAAAAADHIAANYS